MVLLSFNSVRTKYEYGCERMRMRLRMLNVSLTLFGPHIRTYLRSYIYGIAMTTTRQAKPRNDFRIARNKSFSLRIFMYRCACFWLNQLWFERSLLHTCHLINTRKNDSVSVSVWTLPKSAKRFWTYQWAFVRTLFPNVQSNSRNIMEW